MADAQWDCGDLQGAGHCSTFRVPSLDSEGLLGSSKDGDRCARAYIEQTALAALRVSKHRHAYFEQACVVKA